MFNRIIFCIAILSFTSWVYAVQGFDAHFGVPEGTNFIHLVNVPTEINSYVNSYFDGAACEKRLAGYSDYHTVFEADYDVIVALLSSPENIKKYSESVIEVRNEKVEGTSITAFFDLGMTFLGHKLSYISRMQCVREPLSRDETGFRTRLIQSLDGNLYESYSSWYVKKVIIDGRPMVYLRYFSRQGIRKPFFGMSSIVKMFSAREMKCMFTNLARLGKKNS